MVTVNQALAYAANTARGGHMAPKLRADAAASVALWFLGLNMHATITRNPGERWQAYVRRTAANMGV